MDSGTVSEAGGWYSRRTAGVRSLVLAGVCNGFAVHIAKAVFYACAGTTGLILFTLLTLTVLTRAYLGGST